MSYRAESLEKLDMHLVSCEVYECDTCEKRTTFLKDMKLHIESEHGGGPKKLYHIKMNRDDPLLVDFKDYNSDEVWNEWKLNETIILNCNLLMFVLVSFLGECSR